MNRRLFFLADTYVNVDPTADEIVAITLQAGSVRIFVCGRA
ncbi:MAG: hypothetical protein KKF14_05075 [Alphaproteobacteria bacterium]|nr:hypothetical protein [Alphaproteobacteria bacterium]